MKTYTPNRDFDGFKVGQEVELDPDNERHAGLIATGYLDERPEVAEVAPREERPASVAATLERDDSTGDEGEADTDGDEGAGGAGPRSRARGRR